MDNPKTLASLGTQDRTKRSKETLEKTEEAIRNGQSKDTGIIGHPRQDEEKQRNLRENRRSNKEWTIQRHWHHWVPKTGQEKQRNLRENRRSNKNRQSKDTGNIGYTRHRTNKRLRKPKGQSRIDNPKTLASLGTQDRTKRSKETLEKTEEAIRNGQSKDTGIIGYTRHRTNKRLRKPEG